MRRALKYREHRESGSFRASLEPTDIEQAYCALADKSNVEPIFNVRQGKQSILENYIFWLPNKG